MIGMQTDLARTSISQAFRRAKVCIGCVSGNMDLSLSSNTLYSYTSVAIMPEPFNQNSPMGYCVVSIVGLAVPHLLSDTMNFGKTRWTFGIVAATLCCASL